MRVNWMPNNKAARRFREADNAPGIVFHYVSAWTRQDEADKVVNRLKRQGKKYRTQIRASDHGPVHVVFVGRPKK